MVGKCVGDAIGFPVEGYDREGCAYYLDNFILKKTLKLGRGRYRFGQYTDDSQLARDLLINLVENGKFDPEMYAKQIIHLFANNLIVGRGISTHKAYERLESGTSWKDAGEPGPVAGNGTAMRAAPVGMFYYNDNDKLVDIAVQQGLGTHKDERTKAGSVIIAAGVAYLLTHDEIDINHFLQFLAELTRPYSDMFADLILRLGKWVTLPYEVSLSEISQSGGPMPGSGWDRISPYVVPSVLWSIYSFLISTTGI